MGLFLNAAAAWKELSDTQYILDLGKKGKLDRVTLSFLDEDFPHLAGMQYAKDVDFGLDRAEYYGERLIPALLNQYMDGSKIEKSRNWDRISGRLTAIINLQNTLDNTFTIVSFNKEKVRGYSRIDAKFAIKSSISDEVFFVFLDEKSGRYYCKSAFKKEQVDYVENQSALTVLQKIKIVNGESIILSKHPRYTPDTKKEAAPV